MLMWETETEAPEARERGIQSMGGGGGLPGQGHMSHCGCKKKEMGLDAGIMRL